MIKNELELECDDLLIDYYTSKEYLADLEMEKMLENAEYNLEEILD